MHYLQTDTSIDVIPRCNRLNCRGDQTKNVCLAMSNLPTKRATPEEGFGLVLTHDDLSRACSFLIFLMTLSMLTWLPVGVERAARTYATAMLRGTLRSTECSQCRTLKLSRDTR